MRLQQSKCSKSLFQIDFEFRVRVCSLLQDIIRSCEIHIALPEPLERVGASSLLVDSIVAIAFICLGCQLSKFIPIWCCKYARHSIIHKYYASGRRPHQHRDASFFHPRVPRYEAFAEILLTVCTC